MKRKNPIGSFMKVLKTSISLYDYKHQTWNRSLSLQVKSSLKFHSSACLLENNTRQNNFSTYIKLLWTMHKLTKQRVKGRETKMKHAGHFDWLDNFEMSVRQITYPGQCQRRGWTRGANETTDVLRGAILVPALQTMRSSQVTLQPERV